MMFFELDPPGGLEQYLGAWGHLLAASSDLIDLVISTLRGKNGLTAFSST